MDLSRISKVGLFIAVVFLFSAKNAAVITSRVIIEDMIAGANKVITLKFKLKKKERVDGTLLIGEQDVKFQRNPKKVYTKIFAPNKGVEVLYVDGQNNQKAYVNPNAFPYVTLSLDPYGSLMRNNNHHTVHEVGFDYITQIISFMEEKSGDNFDTYFKYQGDTIFNNRNCYKILIDYTPFAYVNYTVKPGENVADIAYKLFVSDYMILQLNDLDDYNDVSAGQVIKVPNAYARKTILCIDKVTNLPIVQRMYDDKGLFAQYEFYNVQLNPGIPAAEFTKEYKDYNF